MTEQSKTRIPTPLYAAAGAGDLAYEQLRRLPTVMHELREKAETRGAELRHRAADARVELREKANATLKAANKNVEELRGRTLRELDLDHLREAARRNANSLLTEAKATPARAVEVYHQLVARGERVVGSGVVEAAETVNADIEATEAAELPTAEVIEQAKTDGAAKTPTKRTRPAATRK